MILGQTRHADFTRPEAASPSFRPGIPGVGFYSHFQPFNQVMRRMPAANGFYMPQLNPNAGPGVMPNVPAPAPAVTAPAPSAPAVQPKAGGMAGFSGIGFGSTGGTRGGHAHIDPYMIMRQGVVPGVMPSGSNIRYGVTHVDDRVQRSLPFQSGNNRSIMLSPPPPPPPPAPVAPAPTMKGFGAPRHRRGRGWFSRMFSPPTVAEVRACETYGPRPSDGLTVTVCNGRVTEYRDAAGNVRQVTPHDYA